MRASRLVSLLLLLQTRGRLTAELGLGSVMAAAQLKLKAAMPPELADRSGRIQQRFHLDAPSWYDDGDTSPFLPSVADAVWNEVKIRVRYRRWIAPTDVDRTLAPYGIVLKSGRWYVVAECDGRVNTYRVNQILELATLPESFERPAGFDLPGYWRSQVSEFRNRLITGDAHIRLSETGRRRLVEAMAADVVKAVDGTAEDDCERAGWIKATVPIESLTHAEGEFLKLGAEVEVMAPIELRERIARTAARLAGLYEG